MAHSDIVFVCTSFHRSCDAVVARRNPHEDADVSVHVRSFLIAARLGIIVIIAARQQLVEDNVMTSRLLHTNRLHLTRRLM